MCNSRNLSTFVLLFLGLTGLVQQVVAQAQPTSSNLLTPEVINQLQAKAQKGDSVAQFDLGKAYEDGNGIPQSDKLALRWYRTAAEQGNATAQNRVGLMFGAGLGVEKDKLEAARWFRKAARQEEPKAMFNLGTVYYNGDGVGIDDIAAYAWFLLAQSFGNGYAADAVRRMKEEKGNLESEALEKIGDMYQKGDDLPQNLSQAIKWYRKAAENGAEAMQVKLASLILQSQTGTSKYAEVQGLCEKAATRHYGPGAACMGALYFDGLGVERNLPMAAKWFREAASLGNALALLRLGQMYWKGEGVKQDKTAAYEFIYLASTSNLQEAKQEKERLEKELTSKELGKAKAKAVEWGRQHPPLALNRNH